MYRSTWKPVTGSIPSGTPTQPAMTAMASSAKIRA